MSAYAFPGLFPPLPSCVDPPHEPQGPSEGPASRVSWTDNHSAERQSQYRSLYYSSTEKEEKIDEISDYATSTMTSCPQVSVRASIDTPKLLQGMTSQQHKTSQSAQDLSLEEQAIVFDIHVCNDDSSHRMVSKTYAGLVDMERDLREDVPLSPALPRLQCKPGALGHLQQAVQRLASQMEGWFHLLQRQGQWPRLAPHFSEFLIEDIRCANLTAIVESDQEDDDGDE